MGKRNENDSTRSSGSRNGSGAAVISGLILMLLAIGCGYFAIKGDMEFGKRIGLGIAALVLAAIGNTTLHFF